MKALILVDLQNDFLPGGALAVNEGDQIIATANRLMSGFDCILATQDWHPADHLSFASQHNGSPGDVIDLEGLQQVLWPDHCVQNTTGAAFAPGLTTHRFEKVFQKGTNRHVDSYSGFWDNGRRQNTGMAHYLHDRGVQDLCIMGLATDYCVKFTVLDALAAYFSVTVVLDGCRGVELNPGDCDKAVQVMTQAGAVIERDVL